jgi:hypothetical protein
MTSTKQPDIATLEYIGPEGHESDTFGGLLVAGRRYQCAADLAAYLSDTHPTFWRLVRPKAPAVTPPAEE